MRGNAKDLAGVSALASCKTAQDDEVENLIGSRWFLTIRSNMKPTFRPVS